MPSGPPPTLEAALTTVALDPVDDALLAVPAAAGVAQFLAEGGKNLLIGRGANLRKWVASHLGRGPAPKPGHRPPLDLRPVAAALRFLPTRGEFEQRLLFERLMAGYVPLGARRDLKPPAWLHLDAAARFPRLTARGPRAAAAGGPLFGPFRDVKAAGRARDLLHKRLPLRPCEYDFEPHPELPLGLGCVFAQTRTCAAPCLARVGEDDYRALAGQGVGWLAGPRAEDDALPSWISAREARALIVDPLKDGTLLLYPVRAGRVLEAEAGGAPPERLEEALSALAWPAAEGPDDWPWLVAWLLAPRRKGRYLVVREEGPEALAGRVRAALH